MRLVLAAVNAVATDAADVGLGVRRRAKSGCAPAWQLRHFSSTSLVECLGGVEDLGHVTTTRYVLAARAMAVLAGHAGVVSGHHRPSSCGGSWQIPCSPLRDRWRRCQHPQSGGALGRVADYSGCRLGCGRLSSQRRGAEQARAHAKTSKTLAVPIASREPHRTSALPAYLYACKIPP